MWSSGYRRVRGGVIGRGTWAALTALTTCALLFSARPARGQERRAEEKAKLFASDGEEGDNFGRSVALDGDVAIIGTTTDEHGYGSGSAYIFRFDPKSDEWVEEAKLIPPGLGERHRFGLSVSLHEGVALVGTLPSGKLGEAYVFRYDGDEWVQEAKLMAPDGEIGDRFGQSVSLFADVAIVGAELDWNENGARAGAAYVFRRNGNAWILEDKIMASDGGLNHRFGVCVSLYENVFIVGAKGHNVSTGAAYVYRYDGRNWGEEAKLTASDGRPLWRFGGTAAMHDDVTVVGQVNEPIDSVYVFRFNRQQWVEEAKLFPSEHSQNYADTLAIDGNLVIVGASYDDERARRAGAAYLYRFDGREWKEEQKLFASDWAEFENFGSAVTVNGYRGLIGASGADIDGVSQGAVYAMDVSSCTDCTGKERIKNAECTKSNRRNKLTVKLVHGESHDTFLMELSTGQIREGSLNGKGNGKGRIKRLPSGGPETVTVTWGCGARAVGNYTCP